MIKRKHFRITTIKTVNFSDLSGHLMENGGFNQPSYGDLGTETLVEPFVLINELLFRDANCTDGPLGHLSPLIAELQSIPAGVMVNLG